MNNFSLNTFFPLKCSDDKKMEQHFRSCNFRFRLERTSKAAECFENKYLLLSKNLSSLFIIKPINFCEIFEKIFIKLKLLYL